MRLCWIVLLVSIIAGCQPEPEATTPAEGDYLIELPAVGQSELSPGTSPGGSDGLLLSGGPIDLAYGSAYPTELRVRPILSLVGSCETSRAEFRWTDVKSESPHFSAEIADNGFEVSVESVGAGAIEVTGSISYPDASSAPDHEPCKDLLEQYSGSVPFVATFDFRVHDVAGVVFDSCVQGPKVSKLAGTTFRDVPLPVDSDGTAFLPANANPARAVTVRIGGDPESLEFRENTQLGEPTLSDLILPAEASEIVISTPAGESAVVHVVEPSAVTELDAFFEIPGTSGNIRIEDGATYGAAEYLDSRDRVFPVVGAAGGIASNAPFCSPLDTEQFELTSDTPEVCVVESRELTDYHSFKTLMFGGRTLERAAHLEANGECSLRLEAAKLNGGAGLSWSVTTNFEDTSELISLDRPED